VYKKYLELKEKDKKTLYIFSMGVFLSFLDEDAEYAHRKLGLKLTKLNDSVYKCGFPKVSKEKYLKMLDNHKKPYKIVEFVGSPDKEVIKRLEELDYNSVTPIQASNILKELCELLDGTR